ncbi:hypothetical protein [Nocardia sp. NPDC051570]|uniref:hypothetical protein n=1 Tax=Nocardia sp. NPDC051570 TaxID=3364324 RepID=UPI00379786A7
MEIPEPYEQPDATGELTTVERGHLASCEAALDVLRVAFWRAGKALRVISAARLYRETHETFEAYVFDRWQMRRAQAYRLMDAAVIGEPIALSPMGDKVNERQVRELLPLADNRGGAAAVDLYLALAREIFNANGSAPKITADLVHKTVAAALAALPPGTPWDSDIVLQAVRTVLKAPGDPVTDDTPGESQSWFEAETGRVATLADRAVKRARKHPNEAAAFADALIEHARRIQNALEIS